ncbi:phosphatidylcholine and lysophosphatidylcholine phospholipase, partial [Cladochytrium tenue]
AVKHSSPLRSGPKANVGGRGTAKDRTTSKTPTGSNQTLNSPGVRIDTEEDAPLKESIFDCISAIIGMVPSKPAARSSQTTAPSSRTSSPRVSTVDILLSNEEARQRAYFGAASLHPFDAPRLSRRASIDSIDSQDDAESASAVSNISSDHVSSQSNFAARGSDIRIVSLERGEVLFSEGERVNGLWFCLDGILEASMRDRTIDYAAGLGDSNYDRRHGSRRGKSVFLIKPGGLAGYLAVLTGAASFVTIRAKTDAQVGFLPKAALDRWTERYPNVLMTLAKRLVTQMSPLVLHIDVALDWAHVNAGQVLYRQNDPSDSIYIVLHGRLRSIIEHYDDDENGSTGGVPASPVGNKPAGKLGKMPGSKFASMGDYMSNANGPSSFEIAGEFGAGESVGELEVLTDTRRPTTVHAIRDTEIAVMPRTLFNALAMRYPEITIHVSRLIASRLRSVAVDQSAPQTNGAIGLMGGAMGAVASQVMPPAGGDAKSNLNLKTVALLPVSAAVPVAEFAERLRSALELIGASVGLFNTASVMGKLGRHAFSRIGRLKLVSWLAEQEENYRIVLYVADGGVNSPWTQRCVRQADCILLVGLGDEDPEIGEYERVLIAMKTTAKKELVLLHNERS